MNSPLTQEDIRRYNIIFWKCVFGMITLVMLLIFGTGLGLFGKLPSFRDLENPKSNLASEIISSDDVVLGTYFIQNRSNVRYNEISPNVINALIATEDIRFYNHSGIDFKRTVTIFYHNLTGKKQGASTITQQLARILFSKEAKATNTLKRFVQKLKEIIIAIKLERNYSKEEIITMYLNIVDFGSYNTFGIKSAARTYFNTTPSQLAPEQAAVLIGMLRSPSRYSPTRNPERSLARRNTVLSNMERAGYLGYEETIRLQKKKLNLAFNISDHKEGLATYFRNVLRKDVKNILQKNDILKPDGTPYDLDRDGLRIYTTIDSRMQRYAEDAQREYLRGLQNQFNVEWRGKNPFKGVEQLIDMGIANSDRYRQGRAEGKSETEIKASFYKPTKMTIFSWRGNIDTIMRPVDSVKYYKMLLRNAIMSMEPQTGYVRSWVGGIDYEHFKYDQVKMGTRQIGSTAKTFMYATALEKGYSPCFQVLNEPVDNNGWTPKSGNTIPGYLTLKKGLAKSQNNITAYLMREIGPTAVATLIKRMGITSNVPPYPSICLGSFDASLYDVVGSYSAFVNHGVWIEPIYLLRIEDKKGLVLYENKPKVRVVMEEQYAYAMTNMLKDVVTEGTAVRLRYRYNFTNPMGGKTGTTQNNSDAWFIGITPQLVTGVWTGCEDRAIHFATNQGEGANSALPMFALFMKRVYADPNLKYSKGDFEPPKTEATITMDCSHYNDQMPKPEVSK